MRYFFGAVNAAALLWLVPHLKWDGPDWFDGGMFLTLIWWVQWPTMILWIFLMLGSIAGFDKR